MIVTLPPMKDGYFSSSLKEVTDSFRAIRTRLAELDALERESSLCEDELETFLESYYARVLPLTARLERLRYRKTHGIFPPRHIMGETVYTRSRYEQNPITKRKKDVFRSLVKRCHPDNKQNESSIGISDVYEAKTLQELWLLEIASVCQMLMPEAVRSYLEQQRIVIVGLAQETRHYITGLHMSDLWQLKENVYEAALAGEDLIEAIQTRIENQIVALQQYFVKPREFQQVA